MAVGSNSALARRAAITGHSLEQPLSAERGGDPFQVAGPSDESHSVANAAEGLRPVKFFLYARVRPLEGDTVPMRLGNGDPLLVEHQVGKGRVLVFASSLDNVWNDLPVTSVYVPFVAETVRYLTGAEAARGEALLGEVLELGRRRGSGSAVQVLDPAGRASVESVRFGQPRGSAAGCRRILRDSRLGSVRAAGREPGSAGIKLAPRGARHAGTLAIDRRCRSDASRGRRHAAAKRAPVARMETGVGAALAGGTVRICHSGPAPRHAQRGLIMIFGHQAQPSGSLEKYLGSIVLRLRAAAAAKGVGALGLTALTVTAVCVFLANQAAFSAASVVGVAHSSLGGARRGHRIAAGASLASLGQGPGVCAGSRRG